MVIILVKFGLGGSGVQNHLQLFCTGHCRDQGTLEAERRILLFTLFFHLPLSPVNPLVISKYGASKDYPGILDCLVRLAKDGTQFALLNFFLIIFSSFAQDIAEIKELLKQKGGDVDCQRDFL
ncbi:hypothetical protein CFP56_043883 [Quercus suber]|uniref:Uncharacterized protein n=1 Tax=Quercus suber TaxID=58331 RepID=A0AAW0IPK7_QUESU